MTAGIETPTFPNQLQPMVPTKKCFILLLITILSLLQFSTWQLLLTISSLTFLLMTILAKVDSEGKDLPKFHYWV